MLKCIWGEENQKSCFCSFPRLFRAQHGNVHLPFSAGTRVAFPLHHATTHSHAVLEPLFHIANALYRTIAWAAEALDTARRVESAGVSEVVAQVTVEVGRICATRRIVASATTRWIREMREIGREVRHVTGRLRVLGVGNGRRRHRWRVCRMLLNCLYAWMNWLLFWYTVVCDWNLRIFSNC